MLVLEVNMFVLNMDKMISVFIVGGYMYLGRKKIVIYKIC